MVFRKGTNDPGRVPMVFRKGTNDPGRVPMVFRKGTNDPGRVPMVFRKGTNDPGRVPMVFRKGTNDPGRVPMVSDTSGLRYQWSTHHDIVSWVVRRPQAGNSSTFAAYVWCQLSIPDL